MAWAGWGAGPAGAGAAGGPSRWFLLAALIACAVMTVILALRHSWLPDAVAALATLYYASRLFLGLGQRRGPDEPRK
jgi:hypothetical protein